MHDGRSKLQVKVRLDSLLGDRLRDSLSVSALELPREQVVQPTLKERNDTCQDNASKVVSAAFNERVRVKGRGEGLTSHEEEPNPPSRLPEADSGSLSDRTRVKPVVDQVLKILAHSDLLHELVLVPVH